MITHPEKVLFPDDGITKGELASYYEAIAPLMLPHLRGRPVTMERYPSGIGEQGLHAEGRIEGLPGLARARRGAEEGRHRAPSACQRHAFAALARQPELHHAARLDVARAEPLQARPLRLRPRSVGRRARRNCARPRSPCATCSTNSACRAGSRRPARRGSTSSCRWTARTASTKSRASRTPSGRSWSSAHPEHLTQEFSKADRGGRIYVDTGRNGYSATFAAAYAVRAQARAPVSAPCTWDEIEHGEGRAAILQPQDDGGTHLGCRRSVGGHAQAQAVAATPDGKTTSSVVNLPEPRVSGPPGKGPR